MTTHYLTLSVHHQVILISLNQVHMVLPIMALQTVPNPHPALEGFLNYDRKTTASDSKLAILLLLVA